MKYYKFNRDQSTNALFKYKKSWRKMEYRARRNKLRILDSFYFENQCWGALHKAWKGYVIAKNKDEFDRLEYYALVIRNLQKELGLEISTFPDLGLITSEVIDENSEY